MRVYCCSPEKVDALNALVSKLEDQDFPMRIMRPDHETPTGEFLALTAGGILILHNAGELSARDFEKVLSIGKRMRYAPVLVLKGDDDTLDTLMGACRRTGLRQLSKLEHVEQALKGSLQQV